MTMHSGWNDRDDEPNKPVKEIIEDRRRQYRLPFALDKMTADCVLLTFPKPRGVVISSDKYALADAEWYREEGHIWFDRVERMTIALYLVDYLAKSKNFNSSLTVGITELESFGWLSPAAQECLVDCLALSAERTRIRQGRDARMEAWRKQLRKKLQKGILEKRVWWRKLLVWLRRPQKQLTS